MNETPADLFPAVRRVIAAAANIPEDRVQLDSDLLEDLAIDSLAMYEIVVDLESAYDIRISDEDIRLVRTVRDMIQQLAAKRTGSDTAE